MKIIRTVSELSLLLVPVLLKLRMSVKTNFGSSDLKSGSEDTYRIGPDDPSQGPPREVL